MIRKFRLINREGAAYDLNSKQSFFHKVGGLGFRDETGFQKIGTDYYALEEVFSQGEITGNIFFYGKEAYVRYRDFARFIRMTPLTLEYVTDDTYRLPVRVGEINKSELMDGGIGLDCEVTLLATGLFYRSVTKYSETVYVGGKIYPYTYPYSYADVSANTLMIDSDSFADSPCKITIYGPCENPVWKHYVNNELYATGAYNGILRADHKLVIDTTKVPYSITEQGVSGEVIADRYQACDFTTKRFILLQNGTNRISLSHDGLNSVDMMVEAKISYETV
jgi:hypothetical protein